MKYHMLVCLIVYQMHGMDRSKTLSHSTSFSVMQGKGVFKGTNIVLTQSANSRTLQSTIAPEVSKKNGNSYKK